jgi:hypothetical protein
MNAASTYWQLMQLNSTGQCRAQEILSAKIFFQEHFAAQSLSDALIQRELQLLRESASLAERQGSEWCLRCYISRQIKQVCVQLEVQFGAQHGFTRRDLFPFVLNDDLSEARHPARSVSRQYQSLGREILQTFDASRAGLNTWVTRQVRHHRELRKFLQEHGVYLATDWGILNDSSPELLRKVLAEFYLLTAAEIRPACDLLQAYHQVYRHDRLQQRQRGELRGKGTCIAPSQEQLTRMGRYLQEPYSPEQILAQLQTIATQLRQYKLHRASKTLPTKSLDQPGGAAIVAKIQTTEPEIEPEEENFLIFYRQQMLACLDQALAQATHDRFVYLQRKNIEEAQQFLTALELLHCQGQSMGRIAPQVALNAQYQVTRLLQLDKFRENVQSRLLQLLLNSVLDQAATYIDPVRLQRLNRELKTVLEEDINKLIQQAKSETAVAKQGPLPSLFSRRLCHHLDHLNNGSSGS